MTTTETMPALRTRLLVDLETKRSYLQLAGEGLDHHERNELVRAVREQLGLTAQELDGVFSISDPNMPVLESNDGLTYVTWQQVAMAISNRLKTHVSVITQDDVVAFATVHLITTVGEILTAVTNALVSRAVRNPELKW